MTITGPGGVGKTRLAEAVAGEQEFDDGIVHVPLAAISDPELVLPTIARATGTQRLELGDSALLLVLDNLGQVAAAGPRLLEVLDACPRLKVLATSRTRLRLTPEREFPLAPLALPDSVLLFVERARGVRPDLDTGEAELRAIEQLCASLDGLPLAIELAAARAKLLSPEALRTRLGDRLGLLAGGAADLPERQQTLRATLDWSFELLGDDEQRLPSSKASCKIGNPNRQSCRCGGAAMFRSSGRDHDGRHDRRRHGRSPDPHPDCCHSPPGRMSFTATIAGLLRRFGAHVQAGGTAAIWTSSAGAQFSLLPRSEQNRPLDRGYRN